jgi:hypothetical protein
VHILQSTLSFRGIRPGPPSITPTRWPFNMATKDAKLKHFRYGNACHVSPCARHARGGATHASFQVLTALMARHRVPWWPVHLELPDGPELLHCIDRHREFDYAGDPRWAAYMRSVELPAAADTEAVLTKLKAKWYKKNVDNDFDVDWVSAAAASTPSRPTACKRGQRVTSCSCLVLRPGAGMQEHAELHAWEPAAQGSPSALVRCWMHDCPHPQTAWDAQVGAMRWMMGAALFAVAPPNTWHGCAHPPILAPRCPPAACPAGSASTPPPASSAPAGTASSPQPQRSAGPPPASAYAGPDGRTARQLLLMHVGLVLLGPFAMVPLLPYSRNAYSLFLRLALAAAGYKIYARNGLPSFRPLSAAMVSGVAAGGGHRRAWLSGFGAWADLPPACLCDTCGRKAGRERAGLVARHGVWHRAGGGTRA